MKRVVRALPAVLMLTVLAGCLTRSTVSTDGAASDVQGDNCFALHLFDDREVDILFVIDNSNSMHHEQKSLMKQSPWLLDGLRSAKLGGKLPDVQLGIVSSDLGAGSYNLPSCKSTGGDQGKLLNKPQIPGCIPPSGPWISYQGGKTNIPGAKGDPVNAVKTAFQCIAEIGITGCGFEQPFSAARRALDPLLSVNPGFLRQHAVLAVLFLSDEDDCSASNSKLFDPSKQGLSDPLGPLTSFRCFEFGVKCQCPNSSKCDRTTLGPRKNCVPGGSYLHKVEDFITFFNALKKTADGKALPGRVLMAAIAGPTNRVEVGMDGNNPTLKPSCQNAAGLALPAIRIEALVHTFAKELSAQESAEIKAGKSNQPYWVDSSGRWRAQNFSTICSSDYGWALKRLGRSIDATFGTACLSKPALTRGKGLVCRKGDVVGTNTAGKQVKCQKSCLDQADLTVTRITATGKILVPRCPAKLFEPSLATTACGASCPCWRIVPNVQCAAVGGASPYSLEVMDTAATAKGTYATVCGATSKHLWGSRHVADLPQCR